MAASEKIGGKFSEAHSNATAQDGKRRNNSHHSFRRSESIAAAFQDALLELDPEAFPEKLKAADKAIGMRRLELASTAIPDSTELAELTDGLNTLRALGFLQEAS